APAINLCGGGRGLQPRQGLALAGEGLRVHAHEGAHHAHEEPLRGREAEARDARRVARGAEELRPEDAPRDGRRLAVLAAGDDDVGLLEADPAADLLLEGVALGAGL